MVWNRTFGGAGKDEGYSVQATNDGGYIIAGCTESFGSGLSDFWLIKTDENGNKLWDKTFGGTEIDGASSVQQTSDGGYIIIGGTVSYGAGASDVWLIKTNGKGIEEWNKTYGGAGSEYGRAVIETSDGGFAIAGHAFSSVAEGADAAGSALHRLGHLR
jgi:hypothetical protein